MTQSSWVEGGGAGPVINHPDIVYEQFIGNFISIIRFNLYFIM